MPKRQKSIIYDTFFGRGYELDIFCELHKEDGVIASITLEDKKQDKSAYIKIEGDDLKKIIQFMSRMANKSEKGHKRYWKEKQ